MERIIPKEVLKMRAYKYMADIMKNIRQHREEQSEEKQVQDKVDYFKDLDICFKAVTLAGTNKEKGEIAKNVFNIHKENRDNNDITLVCLFIFMNILESMDLNVNDINRDIIKEVIGIGMDIIYNSEIEHHNNPEYIDDFKMYIISIIYAPPSIRSILYFMILNNYEKEKYAETIYNIYLRNPKEEYNEAIINCIEIFLGTTLHSNNLEAPVEMVSEKLYNICDKAFKKMDNGLIKKCLQTLSVIATCCDILQVRAKAFEKICDICDKAFEKGDNISIKECLQSLSEIGQYTPDQTIQEKALEKIRIIYDNAIETGNNIIAVECLQSLSKIVTGIYTHEEAREKAFEKLYTICDNAIKEGNDVIAMKCLQPLSEIKNCTRNQIIRGRASEIMDTVYSSDLEKDIEYSQVDLIRLTQANENMSATVGLDVQYSKSNG